MKADRLDELVEGHLLGELSPEQLAELQGVLQEDAAARGRFVQAMLMETHLHRLVRGESGGAGGGQEVTPIRRFRMIPSMRRVAVAAIVLIALGTAFYLSRPVSTDFARVTSGNVLVDGQSRDRLREGSTLTVSGGQPAVIQLPDGSSATLDPATQMVLRGAVGDTRQVLQLITGGGQFQVSHGGGQFRIETPAGSVTVLGTQFTVALRASDTVFVSVSSGTVRFDRDGKAVTLNAGESRFFGPEVSSHQDGKTLVKTGAIKAVDASARTFEVSLPPRPLTFTCNEKTQIMLDGKVSTFDLAIEIERKVSVTYSREGEERIASRVEVISQK